MTERVLLSGAFNDRRYRFGFFEHIATTLERDGLRVERFNSFGFEPASDPAAKLLERLFTLPGRLLGIDKERIRAALPWTPEGRRERALLKTVRDFRPDTLIVIRGFPHRARTLQACRRLGVKSLVGWYVEGPLEPGLAEAESQLYDRYYCIHTEIQPSFQPRIGWLPSHGLDSQTFRRIDWPRAPQRRIVFVGTPTPRRLRFLEPLRALPLELWGPKWGQLDAFAAFHRGDFIWGAELNALYNDSAIVLNIASWDAHLSGTTQRVVEIPASGAFMLTDDAAEVRALFEPGREIDVFTTPEELRAQCERYLDDEPLRERIADQGHRRALQQADFSVAARVLIGRLPAPSAPRSDPRPASL
jgi:spore maturation protein CgeB